MARPSPFVLVMLLMGTIWFVAPQPSLRVIAAMGIAGILIVLLCRFLIRKGLRALIWVLLGLLAITAFAAMATVRPHLHHTYLPDQLAHAPEVAASRGFNPSEQDAAGNRYAWTQERATLVLDFLVHKPVTFTFTIRSAAVAGGPDQPVQVVVNGHEAGELRPDPANATFQVMSLRLVPYDWGGQRTEVKLLPVPFKPKGDSRTLGTMVQSISIDTSETWSTLGRRLWLLWAIPALALLALGCNAAARRYRSSWLAYGAIALCLGGMGCAATILVLIVRIGFIERDTYYVWTLGSACIGVFFAAGAATAPIRLLGDQSPLAWVRAQLAANRRFTAAFTRIQVAVGPIFQPAHDESTPARSLILRDLLCIFVVALGVRCIWAVVIPPWQAPDEPEHYIYIAHIAEQGQIPHPPYPALPDHPPEVLTSWDLTLLGKISSVGASSDHAIPYLPITYDYAAARNYQTSHAERLSSAGGRATTYPPLYYLYDALPYAIFKGAPIVARLFAVRCGSAILGALSCAFGYLMAYELRRTRRWGRAIGLCMALMPMYAFTTAITNNDAALDLGATVLIWLMVRIYQRKELSLSLALALGVASGLALLTKQTIDPIIGVAGVIVLTKILPAFRSSGQVVRTKLSALGVYAASAAAIYGPWMLFHLRYYGTLGFATVSLAPLARFLTGVTAVAASPLSPIDGTLQPSASRLSIATISLGQYLHNTKGRGWEYFRSVFVRDFWGNFGWLDAPLPDHVFTPIIAVYVIGSIGVLIQLVLQPRRRSNLLLLLGIVLAMALFLFIGVDYYVGFVRSGAAVGLQGRYFFPILAPLLFLLLSGWDHLCAENGLLLRLAPLGMLWLQLIGLATILARYYGVAIG